MFHDRLKHTGDGLEATTTQSVHNDRHARNPTATSTPKHDSPAESDGDRSEETRYNKDVGTSLNVMTGNEGKTRRVGMNREPSSGKVLAKPRKKSVILDEEDDVQTEDSDGNRQGKDGERKVPQKRFPETDASRSSPTRAPVDLASIVNTFEHYQPPLSPSITARSPPPRPRTPTTTTTTTASASAKRFPRDRQRSSHQTRTLPSGQPSTRTSSNRVPQLTTADARKQAFRERERRHVRDRAYMRFVPGLGLSSGATLAILDHDAEYTNERRPRPRARSLGDSEAQLVSFGGRAGAKGMGKVEMDEQAARAAAQVFRDAQDRVTSRPGPNGMPESKAFALPHFSLDTKFSLAPPSAKAGRHHDLSRFVSPVGSGSRSGRGDVSGGETPLDEVEFDLGLGKDLDHTIAEAMKVAQQVNKSKGDANNKPGEASSNVVEGERRPSFGTSIPVPPSATQEMPELPLPAEAAQLLSEARQAVVNCRVVPKSKTGRKASMGMGLFKETAEVKVDRDTRGDASKSRTPVIEEEDPYEEKRTHSLRGHGDVQELDAAALRDQLEHHQLPESSSSLASTVRPKLRGMGSGVSDQARRPVSGSMTPTRERERSRLLGHHLGPRSSGGQQDITEPTPSHRKFGISPAVSRHTSRAASPTVLNSELDHHEWSSDEWWETSSGVSSSAESENYDEEHEEEYFARGPRRDVPPGQVKHPESHSRGRSQDRLGDLAEESGEHLVDPSEGRHRQAGGEMTIPLQPFNNKVGGHSEIYKFTRRAVCKVGRCCCVLFATCLIVPLL